MSGLRESLAWAVMVSIAGMLSCGEADAQSSSSSRSSASTVSSSSTATATATSASSSAYAPLMMPFPFMMNSGNASGLSPTDAAALGPTGNQAGAMFNNPWAAPFLASGMMSMQQGATASTNGGGLGGLATNQFGLMMLANQSQMGGIGSGQLSGVHPGPGNLSRSRTGKPVDPKTTRNASQPAGLAARFFNRTTITNTKPQVLYNRPSSYYPQTGH
jgi:hypothetical protein